MPSEAMMNDTRDRPTEDIISPALNPPNLTEARMQALQIYLDERRRCKNIDGSPFEPSDDAPSAFLCGWDAAMQSAATSEDVVEPFAWTFELARARIWEGDKPTGWCDWGPKQLSFRQPCVPEGSVRNLMPLFLTSPTPRDTLVEAAQALLVQWQAYLQSDLNQMNAHDILVRYELWNALDAALKDTQQAEGRES